MKIISVILCATTVLAAGACEHEEDTTSQYHLSFVAVDARGSGLAGIPIHVGETDMGETDEDGILTADVEARNLDKFPLHAPCPEGFETKDKPREVVFVDTRRLDGEHHGSISIRIVCIRKTQIAAVLIHADGREGLPVLVNGKPRGSTGPEGFAHIRYEGLPGTPFEVALDTSSRPDLLPPNPRMEMQLGSEDGLFLFEPELTERRIAGPNRRRHRRRTRRDEGQDEAKRRPVRID